MKGTQPIEVKKKEMGSAGSFRIPNIIYIHI